MNTGEPSLLNQILAGAQPLPYVFQADAGKKDKLPHPTETKRNPRCIAPSIWKTFKLIPSETEFQHFTFHISIFHHSFLTFAAKLIKCYNFEKV
jgi:hypothetical protein